MLCGHGVDVSRDRLFALLRENKMLVRSRKKYSVTTNSKHWMRKYPNLIRGFHFTAMNQLWVSDIAYIPIKRAYACLSLVTDVCSHKIMGHYLSRILESEGTLNALKNAFISSHTELPELIHHSGRGVQYCCKKYVELLNTNGIRMTKNGDPYEDEWPNLELFYRFEQASEPIDRVIGIYNDMQAHLSCGMKTPAQMHQIKLKPKIRKIIPHADFPLNL